MTGQNSSARKLALVIGATGGIGREVAHALLARGWNVRALHRDPAVAQRRSDLPKSIVWVAGDAMSAADVIAAASGAHLIIHAANPPYYRNWRGLALPMLQRAIEAARASGARLVLPGNVYNFGPDALPVVSETSPQNPQTRKGRVRVEMESMLAQAAHSGVRSLVVRAGDYFGPCQPMSIFKNVMVKPGRPVRSVTYPGKYGVGHAWAYLPDLAEAIVRLAEKDGQLAAFETVNYGGYWLECGEEIAKSVGRVVGRPAIPIRRFPWFLLWLASPVMGLAREVLEMRYLWRVSLRLDNAKLVALIGPEPHRPLDTAVRETLSALGCLGEARPSIAPVTRTV
ncbi:MAG: SDR family NAD(P)-dependent oxidoreductase [Alphaproteobacteria bacterium]|nr:SDR family NAD(P)-dependent oxidoreductase [Alphaproteobacteria bacterium]